MGGRRPPQQVGVQAIPEQQWWTVLRQPAQEELRYLQEAEAPRDEPELPVQEARHPGNPWWELRRPGE